MTEASRVVAALAVHRFAAAAEADVQEWVWFVLCNAFGDETQREVDFGDAGRIDFLVGRVGIEVKVRGSRAAVARQCQRYAAVPTIDAVVLVSTRASLMSGLPAQLCSKPFHHVHLRTFP